jgi:hypothetical protein
MGCANGTTVRQPFALMRQFGICDHQDATAEGPKDDSHLVPRPHTALLQHLGWECLEHPPNSPHFAPLHLIVAALSLVEKQNLR